MTRETCIKYINSMIKTMIGENEKLIEKLLIESHFFMKEKVDISCVSLREINRFGKIYNYFLYNYYKSREDKADLSNEKIKKDAIIFSLYFWYYLKIPTNLRKEYLLKIKSIENLPFEEVSERETNFIVDKIIKNGKWYAKNRGLKQNLFCEFICLVNKEPLIICGKPGSSKTLSINLLLAAMKGNIHLNHFLKIIKK